MPINKDSEAWKEADGGPMVEEMVVEYFRENPEKVLTLNELATAVGAADWDAAMEWSRDMDNLDDEEFFEKYPEDEDHPTPQSEDHSTADFYLKMRRLAQMGIVDLRNVDADAFDTPVVNENDYEEVTAVAYTAESLDEDEQ